jgi:hypothetical protein
VVKLFAPFNPHGACAGTKREGILKKVMVGVKGIYVEIIALSPSFWQGKALFQRNFAETMLLGEYWFVLVPHMDPGKSPRISKWWHLKEENGAITPPSHLFSTSTIPLTNYHIYDSLYLK